MAIYQYACSSHGEFEIEQRMTEEPLTECPKCKEEGKENPVKRLISLTSFILTGSGWASSGYS